MTERLWTTAMVAARVFEAADVLQRLPEERVQGYFSTWPEYPLNPNEAYGWSAPHMRPIPPAPQGIDRMEEVFRWLNWLEPEDVRLVWMRAEGCPWKAICWRFGIGRATAHRRWEYALSVIAWRLDGRSVPTKRSRRVLVDRVRSASRGF
ncbi:MAG: DUF6362 family protein [Proteobacteria bacterium]|nr:DUF6362 family protein [Pseudomonadota bacterium]